MDGSAVKTASTAATPDNTGTQPLRVGANSINTDSYFTGNVDEVRVWNRALTPAEVSDAYSKGTFNTSGQLVHASFRTIITTTLPSPPPSPHAIGNFVKDPDMPLLLGHTEPDVIEVDGTFYMYYRNDGTSKPSIALASSTDGLEWTERGTTLTASSVGFDSAEVIAPPLWLTTMTENTIIFITTQMMRRM